ncbi:MAG: hypothetical protein M1834_003826 [Cirrosporium novae-zelandiae]|nr:MAG: hypothetical protein M1834_003826 [Cirrosporium novae-zelandiae]
MSLSNSSNSHPYRPTVLITEKISQDGIDLLSKTLDVHQKLDLQPDDLLRQIGDYNALIIRSETKVDSKLISAARKLKAIARAGVGVDNVDVEAATKQGIIVVNSPSGNIQAAAEHTIALLLATARNVSSACAALKSGKWERSKHVGVEVKGRTLGIIGLGKVGLSVARMANGLGMKVVAMDPYASPEIAATNRVSLVGSMGELLPMCDWLTVHTPLIASTLNMISRHELATMKKTARILNVARGGVIDEVALLEALEQGSIGGAGIDVWSSEPPASDSSAAKLIAHPLVVSTPHLGASTVEAQENVSIDVCRQVVSVLRGDLPTSAVNAPLILPEEYRKLQPFVKLVEKIGSLYTQHFATGKTRLGQQSFDLVYEGEIANISNTRPLFAALVKGLTESISDHQGRNINIVNAPLVARERGIIISESHSRDTPEHTYSSLVTLHSRPARSASQDRGPVPGPEAGLAQRHVISGFVSVETLYISRLGRFATNFIPSGTLIICHNYDTPGKIGSVGSVLGKERVNIHFMSVAALEQVERTNNVASAMKTDEGVTHGNEALMILGVDGEVGKETEEKLREEEGILDVSVVRL